MPIYMQIPGIKGSVTSKGFENWIELTDFYIDVQRKLQTQPGRVANREASQPCISEVHVKKFLDKSSSLLFNEATAGNTKTSVKIQFITTTNNASSYLEYTLSNVLISSHTIEVNDSIKSNESCYPIESLHLNFDKIEMKVIPYDKDHKAQSAIPAGYDLNKAAAT